MTDASVRHSRPWIAQFEQTGRWYEPEWWRLPEYVAASPWTVDELDDAFDALRRIYPPEVTKKMLRKQPRVTRMLLDPFAPHVSGLVALGLDAAVTRAWTLPRLVARLRNDDQFDGARFELELMAAFTMAKLPFCYEPFPKVRGQPDPDFEVTLAGIPLVFDAKSSGLGQRIRENQEWFETLALCLPAPPHDGELTETFQDLQSSDEGRRWIRAHIAEIRQHMWRVFETVVGHTTFPVEHLITVDGYDVVRLRIHAASGSGSSSFRGVPHDSALEAARVVKNLVEGAASQLPIDSVAGVIVEVDLAVDPAALRHEVEQWFSTGGVLYPQVAVVLVVTQVLLEADIFPVAIPMWRPGAPLSAMAEPLAEQVSIGLMWRVSRIAEWRKTGRDESMPIGTFSLGAATVSLAATAPKPDTNE